MPGRAPPRKPIDIAIVKSPFSWLTSLSINCKTAIRLQSAALDHPLPWRQRWGLRIHLILCRWCHRYGRQLGFLRQAAHSHPDQLTQAVPAQLSPEARERLRQKIRAAAQDGNPSP